MTDISRRAVLKSIGLIGLGAAVGLPPLDLKAWLAQSAQPRRQDDLPPLPPRWQGQPLGRIASAYMNARTEPTTDADIAREMRQNDIVRVRRIVTGQTVYLHNDWWLDTDSGYLYSSFVQPMWYPISNPPRSDLGAGKWAEIAVPFTDAYWDAGLTGEDRFVDRLYYGAVFRVVKLVEGADGRQWYKVQELYQTFYVRATHLRIIPDADLAPLSPEIDPRDKHIEVDLGRQVMVAFERGTPVWAHLVSTGLPDHATPEGRHYVYDKRPGDRMIGGTAADEESSDRYNLAGVPFICYFSSSWAAFHGTYWHNDYGIPRSHGCVNLPPYASRWVWRWTTPQADVNELYVQTGARVEGTRVEVYT